MPALPQSVREAWDKRNGPLVLTTVDERGVPNAIYASCVKMLDDGRVLVVDNYFDKTRKNIANKTSGSALFITEDRKSFQIKGTVEYHSEGPIFDDMKTWADPRHPCVAAAVVNVEEVYSGAKNLL